MNAPSFGRVRPLKQHQAAVDAADARTVRQFQLAQVLWADIVEIARHDDALRRLELALALQSTGKEN